MMKRIKNSLERLRTPNSELKAISNGGFTLIEIIILIVIAGILLPAIIVPFVSSVKGSGKPEMATIAMYLAHQKIEEFMRFDYGKSPELDPTALTAYASAGISGYQWQWQRLYVDSNFNIVGDGIQATNNRGYKRILVRVRDPENSTYEVYSVVTNFP
jgi:type II secretory pathway pseudopilin PulG